MTYEETLSGLEDIRRERVRQWKEDWCRKNDSYRVFRYRREPDLAAAPEPTDEQLNWPESTVTVFWDTGYITITTAALMKLPVSQRNKIQKLGGLK